MNCSFKWLIFWCTAILLLVGGCKKSTPANKQNHFIKQTNHVHEDNVNGRTPPPNNVIESTNFYYNEDGTLQQATVYSDTTTSSTLLKKIDFTYGTNKVYANTYLDTVGNVIYTITFNDKKQVTSVYLPDSSGLYISYFNDRISSVRSLPTGLEYFGFIFDEQNNLLQYSARQDSILYWRIFLEYDNQTIEREFDSRFFTKEIKFIYIGGLDLIQKLGLNYGKATQNRLIRRTEIFMPLGRVHEIYNYGYTADAKGRIIKRNVLFSTDTLFYQFKY